MKMVGVFVDVNNVHRTVGKSFGGRKLDYRKYLEKAVGNDTLFRAIAYGKKTAGDQADKFISYLKAAAFEPKYKDYQKFIDPNTQKEVIRNFSWNVEMAIDIIQMIPKLDVVVVGSSDIELIPLIQYVKNSGMVCNIVASRIPFDLKELANRWTEITEDMLETPKT